MDNFDQIKEFLSGYAWAGNSLYDYILAVLIFVVVLLALKIFQSIILAKLKSLAKKTKTDLDNLDLSLFSKVKPPFYLILAIYFSIKVLAISGLIEKVVNILVVVVIVIEVIQILERLVDFLTHKYISKVKGESAEDHKASLAMASALKIIAKIFFWLIGIALVLSNLGVDITSLIAGLGIGGLAVALALQNVLSDIFSSFSLYFDKPFKIGDFIAVGSNSGTVEKIGLKTTRLRTLQGEELVIANKELTSVRVQNFKKMQKRRVVFSLGVVYETTADKLEKIPKLIEEIIKPIKNAEFSRCHFTSYGDFSLNFEVVYLVNSADYNEYMNVNQEINLKIFKKFADEKIAFAYPTQSVIIEKK